MEFFMRIPKENICLQLINYILNRQRITLLNTRKFLMTVLFVQKYFIKNIKIYLKQVLIATVRLWQLIMTDLAMQKELNFSGEIKKLLKMSIIGSLTLTWIRNVIFLITHLQLNLHLPQNILHRWLLKNL